MATPAARTIRGAGGLAIVFVGFEIGGWGYLLALVGALVSALAFLNVCMIGPLLGAPLDWGKPNRRTELGTDAARRSYRACARQK
ncbi:MAG: hypothetical protein ACT4QG_06410 [Sporichthyaceae bacterium]